MSVSMDLIADDLDISVLDHNPAFTEPPTHQEKSWLGRTFTAIKDFITNPVVAKMIIVSTPAIIGSAFILAAITMTGIAIAFPPAAPILLIPIVGSSLIGLAVTGVGLVIFMLGMQMLSGKDDHKYFPTPPVQNVPRPEGDEEEEDEDEDEDEALAV